MFSFKINKKTSSSSAQKSTPQVVSKRAFNDEDDREEEEPDFIDGLDGDNIISKNQKKKAPKRELVIPLITKNEWRVDGKAEKKLWKPQDGDENENSEQNGATEAVPKGSIDNLEGDSLKQQAIKELMEGASSKSSSDKNRAIPILFQNRVPDGYEEDDNMDVSLRPEQSTLEDYEEIPIEEFGMAMLRGMGWKETEGIGLKNKKVINMAEPKLRPKGMGLGAEAAHLNKDVAPKSSQSKNDDKEDLSFRIGGYAVITRGSKKGYYGQIESFDEDNNRVIIRLAISGKMEAVSKFYVNVVSSKEYKKSSKVINSEKYEEYKSKQEMADKHRREHRSEREYDVDDNSKDSNNSATDEEDREYRRKKSKSNRSNDHRDCKEEDNRTEREYDVDDNSTSDEEEREYRRKKSKSSKNDDRGYRKEDKRTGREYDVDDNSTSDEEEREYRRKKSKSSKRDDCGDRKEDRRSDRDRDTDRKKSEKERDRRKDRDSSRSKHDDRDRRYDDYNRNGDYYQSSSKDKDSGRRRDHRRKDERDRRRDY